MATKIKTGQASNSIAYNMAGDSTGVICIRYIEVDIINVDTTSVTANVKIVEQGMGSKKELLDEITLKNYSYSYTLDTLTETAGSTIVKREQMDPVSSNSSLALTELNPETTYALQITATNKNSGSVEFCSRKVIFTTLSENITSDDTKLEFYSNGSTAVDHIYIKINNEFKHAIIYNNEV